MFCDLLLRRLLVAGMILLFFAGSGFSQKLIRLRNGREYQAVIESRSGDTLKLKLVPGPDKEFRVPVAEVDTIIDLKGPPALKYPGRINRSYLAGKMPEEKREELYLHYGKIKNTGGVLIFSGVILTSTGVGLLFPAAWAYDQNLSWVKSQKLQGAIFLSAGTLAWISGIIMTVTGSKNMKIYKPAKKRFSLDFRTAPGLAGFYLTCRF